MNVHMTHTLMDLFSGKEGRNINFFSLALNNDKFLYEKEYKAFDIICIDRFQSHNKKINWKLSSGRSQENEML